MDIDNLQTFLTLARLGHMTRAAQELHLTQPAVSAQLSKLEDELGHKLFDRTPKGMRLTEAGRLWRTYVEQALVMLQSGQQSIDALSGLQQGSLSIGGGATATTYLLPSHLGAFHARHPGIQLFVREQGSQIVMESVLSGELELGIVTLPTPTTHKHLHIEGWIEDELLLIVPSRHPLSARSRFEWEELDGQDLVLFEAGRAVRELIDSHLQRANVQTQTVMELRSIESIKQMVREGIGAAFVSRFALGTTEHGLAPKSDPILRELGIVWRTDLTLSSAAREFLDMLRVKL